MGAQSWVSPRKYEQFFLGKKHFVTSQSAIVKSSVCNSRSSVMPISVRSAWVDFDGIEHLQPKYTSNDRICSGNFNADFFSNDSNVIKDQRDWDWEQEDLRRWGAVHSC